MKYTVCHLNTFRVDQRGLAGRTFREVAQIRAGQTSQNGAKTRAVQPHISEWTAMQSSLASSSTARVDKVRGDSDLSAAALERGRAAARSQERAATSPLQALRPFVEPHTAAPSPPATPAAGTSVVVQLPARPKRASGLSARANALMASSTDVQPSPKSEA